MDKNNLENICNANNLYKAFGEAKKDVDWKESVQRYAINILSNISKTQDEIRNGTYKTKPMVEFELHERGRVRCIKSQHISDRVVQRSLNDNVLIPRIRKHLIYDNGASLKEKGTDFAKKRFRVHLQKAYKKFKGKGYILFIDFSKYFDNIRHEEALRQLKPFLNEKEFTFVAKCFKDFEVDVSNLSDDEFKHCMDVPFNVLAYEKQTKGEKFMRKSVGIGNQISQVTGILYPYEIDNYLKIVLGLEFVGRFMDDTYIMLDDKERLKAIYEDLKNRYRKLGIFVNEKKTHISKLTEWNTWLKINYKILPSGRVIKKVANDTIRRERKRLRKRRKMCNRGDFTKEQALNCYKSWRGTYKKYQSGYKIHRLDELFKELFGDMVKKEANYGNTILPTQRKRKNPKRNEF